jgi:hypothetical protein
MSSALFGTGLRANRMWLLPSFVIGTHPSAQQKERRDEPCKASNVDHGPCPPRPLTDMERVDGGPLDEEDEAHQSEGYKDAQAARSRHGFTLAAPPCAKH